MHYQSVHISLKQFKLFMWSDTTIENQKRAMSAVRDINGVDKNVSCVNQPQMIDKLITSTRAYSTIWYVCK